MPRSPIPKRLAAPEDPGLLRLELLFSEDAFRAEVRQALQLRRDGRSGRPAGNRTPVHPSLVLLPHAVDRLLHVLRMTNVLELLTTVFARRLDDQRSGADEALQDVLAEADIVDVLEWDLHRVLGDQSLTVENAV